MESPVFRQSETTFNAAEMLGVEQQREQGKLDFIVALIQAKSLEHLGGWCQKSLSELEGRHVILQAMRESKLIDMYERSAGRRFDATVVRRVLSLGLGGNRSADQAAEGALAEMHALKAELESTSDRQLQNALAMRLRLLEYLSASGSEGTRLALDLLQTVLPNDAYQRVLRLARAAAEEH